MFMERTFLRKKRGSSLTRQAAKEYLVQKSLRKTEKRKEKITYCFKVSSPNKCHPPFRGGKKHEEFL